MVSSAGTVDASQDLLRLQTLHLSMTHYIGVITVILFLSFLYKFSSPRMDPREPPILKPRIPLVGHIVGLARHGVDYFDSLRKSQDPNATPASTLPMLNGKVYVLSDVHLIHTAMRLKTLTFDSLGLDFSQHVFGVSNYDMDLLYGGPEHDVEKSIMQPLMHSIKSAMQGEHLARMSNTALRYVAGQLNAMDDHGWRMSNLYLGLRDFMTMATAEGLWGEGNPVRKDASLIDAIWDFESNMQPLFLGVAPSIIARTAVTAREKVIAALAPWYAARKDEAPDVSHIVKTRASMFREYGFLESLGRMEAPLYFVSTTNTIPTLYWFFSYIFLRPELVDRIRSEALQLVTMTEKDDRRLATMDVSKAGEICSLLVSCYREAIRLGNQAVGTRRVIHDTVLTDNKGASYLLKAGSDVMWSVKGLHMSIEAWGDNAAEFDPERFLDYDKFDRVKKQHYMPFGGGKHLCPGRNFAMTELLGFVAALTVGFEVQGLDEANFRLGSSGMGYAVTKPPTDAEGGAVTIKRKKGWEDVEWNFVV
ncbi:cytochrome P450 [Coniochaeta sp. 2T2.1]|nr:cytochrome P450 [Coniochaeta sp. 2T2.1]